MANIFANLNPVNLLTSQIMNLILQSLLEGPELAQ